MAGRRRYDGLFGGGRSDEGLQHGDDGGQTPFDVDVFGFDGLLGADHGLQLLIRLLGGKFPNPPLKILNSEFGPLSDGSLGLTVYANNS